MGGKENVDIAIAVESSVRIQRGQTVAAAADGTRMSVATESWRFSPISKTAAGLALSASELCPPRMNSS